MRYRPEIDGLRALAVIPVILFHAGFQGFGGGFVGVDVFFVISGYLITSIILGEIEEQKFSLAHFYMRRVRRILPALLFISFICVLLAFIFILPKYIKEFAQSLMAVTTFSSNILFWRESGYFDTASELKPLLHTWSLAVEEQYYIVFPAFLLLVWGLGKRRVLAILAAAFVLSLGLAHWGAVYKSGYGAFFLLPTRGWELLIGVFAAFYLRHPLWPPSKIFNQAASLSGLALIGAAIVLFNSQTPFPSLYALVPTIGAALIILCAVEGTFAHRILSKKICVGIGLISYSAYLWHQPLFVFARHYYVAAPSDAVLLVLSVLTFPLAYLTWRYIERPFRDKTIPAKTVLYITLSASLALFAIGYAGYKTNGFENLLLKYRYNDEQAERYAAILPQVNYSIYATIIDDGACNFWSKTPGLAFTSRFEECSKKFGDAVIVLGDSHAINIYNILAKTKKIPFLVGLSQGGCRPHHNIPSCHYDASFDFFKAHDAVIKTIIFHQSGAYLFKDENGNADSQKVFSRGAYNFATDDIQKIWAYLKNLDQELGARIIWLGPFLEFRNQPLRAALDERHLEVNPVSQKIYLKELDPVIMREQGGADAVKYVPFSSLYNAPLSAFIGECFFYRDFDHFTRCGEDLVSQASAVRRFAAELD